MEVIEKNSFNISFYGIFYTTILFLRKCFPLKTKVYLDSSLIHYQDNYYDNSEIYYEKYYAPVENNSYCKFKYNRNERK